MNPVSLFHADGKPAGCFYCEKCRVVHRDAPTAEQCCRPYVCGCGAECPQYWTVCQDCRRKNDAAREGERFEKAEKVTEWGGPVCLPDSDRYYRTTDEMFDDLGDDDLPEYVWTCHERPVCSLDYDSIIESATQDAYEDFDPDQLLGEKELTAALDAFNALNKENVVWEVDYKRALTLNRPTK